MHVHVGTSLLQQLDEALRLRDGYHRVAASGADENRCSLQVWNWVRLEWHHGTEQHRALQQARTSQQQARRDVRAIREAHRDDSALVQRIRLGGRFDELRQTFRTRGEILLIEDPFANAAKEPECASFIHLTARAQKRGARENHSSERDQVVFVSSGAVEQQQRRASGDRSLRVWRDIAMHESQRLAAHILGSRRLAEQRVSFPRRFRRQVNARQYRLDLRAIWLVLLGQLELQAQLVHRLVDRKAGRIGRDLEEHAAGLTKVDGVEVIAIDDGGRLEAPLHDLGSQRQLGRVTVHSKRDVMYGTRARLAGDKSADGPHVHDRSGPTVPGAEPASPLLLRYSAKSQYVGEESLGLLSALFPERDAVKAMDRVVQPDPRRLTPRRTRLGALVRDELEHQAVVIVEGDDLLARRAFLRPLVLHAVLQQTLDPKAQRTREHRERRHRDLSRPLATAKRARPG